MQHEKAARSFCYKRCVWAILCCNWRRSQPGKTSTATVFRAAPLAQLFETIYIGQKQDAAFFQLATTLEESAMLNRCGRSGPLSRLPRSQLHFFFTVAVAPPQVLTQCCLAIYSPLPGCKRLPGSSELSSP